jgi:hypothetical protein
MTVPDKARNVDTCKSGNTVTQWSNSVSRFLFVPPTSTGLFSRIALIGPANGGKTWTGLVLANALGPNTGLIDTEHRRAGWYRNQFKFHHLPMDTFNPADLTEAIADAADQRINPLMIDSWSPFWEGADGMLEQVDKATARNGRTDKFSSGWKDMKPVERRMLEAMLAYPGHLIVTLRTKTEYVVERNEITGKQGPKRIGLKPVQREGLEYDFDFLFDMANAGTATVGKSMLPDLNGEVLQKPTEDLGLKIRAWLEDDAAGAVALNPIDVRNWITPDRTSEELEAKLADVEAAGIGHAAIIAPNGQAGPLGEFLGVAIRRRRKIEAEERDVARSAMNGAAVPA